MILNPNPLPLPLRQWPFLLLPFMLMGITTWFVMPAASGRPRAASPATSNPGFHQQSQSGRFADVVVQPVDRQTVFIDTVKRGNLLRQVRALGNLKQGEDGRMLAALQVPEVMVVAIEVGQPAEVDTSIGVVPGKVFHIHRRLTKGTVRVDVTLDGPLPDGASSGLGVDGTITIGRLDDVLYIGRPVFGQEESTMGLFKIREEGATGVKVQVRLGKASVNGIQVIDGLNEGDKVIISDMSAYERYYMIRLIDPR